MFTASIDSAPDAFERVSAFIRSVSGHFGRAFSLGLFGPAALSEPVRVRPRPPTRIDIDVPAEHCPPALLRILWGMCEWGRLMEALPLQWAGARHDGVPLDLASMELPRFGGADRTYRLVRPRFVGYGEQLVVLVKSMRPVHDEQVDLLESGLDTWASLMLGGLPPEGAAPGESGIGAVSGNRITPVTYQWFVEGLAAGTASIDLLVNFFDAQAAPLALSAVEIES